MSRAILCTAVRLRRKALHAALSHCQACRKSLLMHRTVEDPEERHTFAAHVWNDHPCYECQKPSPIVLIFDNEHSQRQFIEWQALGEAIRDLFQAFYPSYSATMEETYYANHCTHCQALQGDHPTTDWAMSSGRWNTPDAVVPIPGVVETIEAETCEVEDVAPYHVIFADGNKANREISNLRVVCEPCLSRLRASAT